MAKFDVTLRRAVISYVTVSVEAENAVAASVAAEDMAWNDEVTWDAEADGSETVSIVAESAVREPTPTIVGRHNLHVLAWVAYDARKKAYPNVHDRRQAYPGLPDNMID